jgi:hypothetical protein
MLAIWGAKGDPNKPVIATGQTYFCMQTRRQELADDETFKRLREGLKKSSTILVPLSLLPTSSAQPKRKKNCAGKSIKQLESAAKRLDKK